MINADRTERTANETNCPKQHSMQTRIDYFVFVSVYLSSSKRLRILLLLQIAWNAALNMINISILTKHTCQNFKLIRNKNQNKKSIFKCVFITKIHSNVQNRSKKTINIGSGMNAKQRERPKKLAIEC